jgi:hypothetical protein
MNIEQIKEIILQAARASSRPELKRMAQSFEVFIDLYASRGQRHANTEAFFEKLNNSYRDMWQAFEEASTAFGLSGAMIQQYFMNPSNFTPEQWQTMESLKQEISSEVQEPNNRGSAQKKLKKHKNRNMRI